MKAIRDLQVIRLNDRNKLLAGAAAVALAAGLGGLFIGRSLTASEPAPVEQAAPAPKAEQGPKNFIPMTAERMAASGIALEPIAAGSLTNEIIAQATVKATPEGKALLTARADGAVVRINKRLADPVRAGETVALLESREAATFLAERNAASARAQAAQAAAAREQRLFNAKITARQDLEAAMAAQRTAQAELQRAEAAVSAAGVVGGRYIAVRSPISGRLTEVDTQLGAYVSAGTELFNVSNPNSIQVEAAVPVTEAQRIVSGDKAVIELPNGGIVDATVRSVTPALDPQSRSATVVLQLNGAPGGLTQGQAVRARISPRQGQKNGIVLPEQAVQQIDGRDMVFVAVKGGFRAVPVSVGERSGGRIEILEGLRTGQQVVTEGAFVLKSQLGASEAEE
jgi:cobalt-zinc-cadmium efflux system membrane fusion protein